MTLFNQYSKYQKNLFRIFFDNNRPIDKLHKIFINWDFNGNKTTIIQIEVLNSNLYQHRLTKQTINGCNIEILRPFIENFIDRFIIKIIQLIYIKSERDYQNILNTFIMFYKKDINNLNSFQ